MNQTRRPLLTIALALCGVVSVELSAAAAVSAPGLAEQPPSTGSATTLDSRTAFDSPNAASFVLQARDGSLVPLSQPVSLRNVGGNLPAKHPVNPPILSRAGQLLASGLEAPLVVRARGRYPSPSPTPTTAPALFNLVPGVILAALGLWLASCLAHGAHTIQGVQSNPTPRGFFKPRPKSD